MRTTDKRREADEKFAALARVGSMYEDERLVHKERERQEQKERAERNRFLDGSGLKDGSRKRWNRNWDESYLTVRQQREGWTVKESIFYDPHGRPRCSAATRRSGVRKDPKPCFEMPVAGRRRCRLHGGASRPARAYEEAFGEAHRERMEQIKGQIEAMMNEGVAPEVTDLVTNSATRVRWNVPKHLQEAYDIAIKDENYVSSRDDIAMLNAYAQSLLDTVQNGGSPETWKALGETAAVAARAKKLGEKEQFYEAFDTMCVLIAEGCKEQQTYNQFFNTVDQVRKLKETEIKRITAAQNAIGREDALGLFKWYQEVVIMASDAIEDEKARKAFLGEIQRHVDARFGTKRGL